MTLPIVERLRRRAILTGAIVGEKWIEDDPDCVKAADTIEELVALLHDARWYCRESLAVRIDTALAKIGGEA